MLYVHPSLRGSTVNTVSCESNQAVHKVVSFVDHSIGKNNIHCKNSSVLRVLVFCAHHTVQYPDIPRITGAQNRRQTALLVGLVSTGCMGIKSWWYLMCEVTRAEETKNMNL